MREFAACADERPWQHDAVHSATSAQVWLTAATIAATLHCSCSAMAERSTHSTRLLVDADLAQPEPYEAGRMVASTLIAPLGGFVIGAGGALVGVLIETTLRLSSFGVFPVALGLGGYVFGTAWAAALLGWGLDGHGTFGGALAGAGLGAVVATGGLLAAFPLLFSFGSPLGSTMFTATTIAALVLPALGATVAFEASYDAERRHSRPTADVHPLVMIDGDRAAIGVALNGAF
jgi:hypothetical protein